MQNEEGIRSQRLLLPKEASKTLFCNPSFIQISILVMILKLILVALLTVVANDRIAFGP